MNTTPEHLDDEVLSTLLDGAAAESPDAAAHVAACDRCAGRQAELSAARAALAGAPVEALDDLTRRRMVAAALRAGEEVSVSRLRRLPRHPALVGSAAAVILALLVAVPFVTGNDGGTDGSTLTAQAPAEMSREESASGTFLGDLGELSDHANVRLRLGGVAADTALPYAPMEPGPSPAAGAPSASPVPASGATSGGLASQEGAPPAAARSAGPTTTLAGGAGSGSSKAAENSTAGGSAVSDTFAAEQPISGGAADRDRADTDACVASLRNGEARGGRLLRSGVGTYRGRPAVVASFELEGGTIAFVTDRSGCAVLDRFPV